MACHEKFEYFEDPEFGSQTPIHSDDPEYLYAEREIPWGIAEGSIESTRPRWKDVLCECPTEAFICQFLAMNPIWDINNEEVRGESIGTLYEGVDGNNHSLSFGVSIPHAYGLTMMCANHEIVESNNRHPTEATEQQVVNFLKEVRFCDLIAMAITIRSGRLQDFSDLGSPYAGLFEYFNGHGDEELTRQENKTEKVKKYFFRKVNQTFKVGTLTFDQLPANTPIPENTEIDRFLELSRMRLIVSRIFKLGIPTCSLFCNTTSVNWLYYPDNWRTYKQIISNLYRWNEEETNEWNYETATRRPKDAEDLEDEELDVLLTRVMDPYYRY